MRVACPHCLEINSVPVKDTYKKANCGKCKNSLLDNKPIDLNSLNFDEVIVNSEYTRSCRFLGSLVWTM